MRILRDTPSIRREIDTNPDPTVSNLLAFYLQFNGPPDEEVGELLVVMVLEAGDTAVTLDEAMEGGFLVN